MSDGEMLLKIARNFGILFVIIFLFDTIIDGLLWLIDMFVELFHIAIEAVEYSIEILLENIFHTDHFQSELIIVNSVIIIGLFALFRFLVAVPKWFIVYKRNLKAMWLRSIRRRSSNWREMSTVCKIKWFSAYSFGSTCLLFLVTL